MKFKPAPFNFLTEKEAIYYRCQEEAKKALGNEEILKGWISLATLTIYNEYCKRHGFKNDLPFDCKKIELDFKDIVV